MDRRAGSEEGLKEVGVHVAQAVSMETADEDCIGSCCGMKKR